MMSEKHTYTIELWLGGWWVCRPGWRRGPYDTEGEAAQNIPDDGMLESSLPRAQGGLVKSGTVYMVGEDSPTTFSATAPPDVEVEITEAPEPEPEKPKRRARKKKAETTDGEQ
jgi:hypothetical protein